MLLTDSVIDELTWNNKTITEEELDRLLRRLHVRHYCHDFPLALSKGQRLRVVFGALLARKDNDLLLLDEPTTGLHAADIHKLMDVLQMLVDGGDTVVVIEHNLDVIKTADYLVDLGPEGGDGGGTVVATGTPEEICKIPASYTGQFLKPVLERTRAFMERGEGR